MAAFWDESWANVDENRVKVYRIYMELTKTIG